MGDNLITLTDSAYTKLREIKGCDVRALRISVIGGGCSGLSYKLSWDVPADNEEPFKIGDLYIVVDSKSALFLKGMQLDHTDGLDGVGFTFSNPNAKKSCGCGSSFSV